MVCHSEMKVSEAIVPPWAESPILPNRLPWGTVWATTLISKRLLPTNDNNGGLAAGARTAVER
jgi:hypothetical protein